ncbi:hypothetical protein [Streptomyces pristinaespiralis]|uniref:hypothetical protein n=1 Tax=Streptomyces pristinaespiralis TaxID=38300 RepID=UPI0033FC4DA8
MGRQQWGKTAVGVMVAAAVMVTSGCGGEAEAKKPAASASPSVTATAPTLEESVRHYQDDMRDLNVQGCPADCGKELSEVYNNALSLRKSMNDSEAAPGTFTEAYRLIDELQQGYIVGADMSEEAGRPLVLGPARELNTWLNEHPVE